MTWENSNAACIAVIEHEGSMELAILLALPQAEHYWLIQVTVESASKADDSGRKWDTTSPQGARSTIIIRVQLMHTWHSGCAVAKLGTRDALCMYLWQEGLKTSTAAQPSVKTIMSSARWLLMHIYECTVYILSTSQGPPISTTRCKSGAAGHAPGKSLLPISKCAPHGLV